MTEWSNVQHSHEKSVMCVKLTLITILGSNVVRKLDAVELLEEEGL